MWSQRGRGLWCEGGRQVVRQVEATRAGYADKKMLRQSSRDADDNTPFRIKVN